MSNKFKVGDVVRILSPETGIRKGEVFAVTEVVPPRSSLPGYVRGAGEFDGGIFEQHLELATLSTEPTAPFSNSAGRVERNNLSIANYGLEEERRTGVYFHRADSVSVSIKDAREFAENILRIAAAIENDISVRAATPVESEEDKRKRKLNEQIAKLQTELDTLKTQAKKL